MPRAEVNLYQETQRLERLERERDEEITRLRGELSRAAVRDRELRGVLGQMEFIDTATAQGHQPVCARCGGWKRKEGHRPGCDLAWCLATPSPLSDAVQEVLEAAVKYKASRRRWAAAVGTDGEGEAKLRHNGVRDDLFTAVDRYHALLDGRGREEG